jgi:hypothetical protein
MSASEYRVFYAAGKGANPVAVFADADFVKVGLTDIVGTKVTVICAHEEWAHSFATIGSWDGWARDVATGRRYPDYEPKYHVFVCPDLQIGKATAQILELALAERKPVLYWPSNSMTPVKVIGVNEDDPQNYKGGWSLSLES